MEENLDPIAGSNLSPEQTEAIKKKAAELKAKDPKIKKIIPLVVDGDEDDDKDFYVGYFSQPSLINFSKYMTLAQKDQVMASRQLANDCFIDGDRELVDDESLFLFGLFGQLQHLITMRGGRVINLSKPGK